MRVVVRLRPSDESVVKCDPHVGTKISTAASAEELEFDAVLGVEATQREAFLTCGLPMLEAALDGQRACLFAYGQTGSGKTFSLLGAEGGKNPHKLDGIVPQIVSEMFRRFAAVESIGVRYNLHATFVELHNEYVRDLIDEPDKNGNQPCLKAERLSCNPCRRSPRPSDAPAPRTQVVTRDKEGLGGTEALEACRVRVPSSRALTKIIEDAMARRVTEDNNYNEHSSRSHALLTLELERRANGTSQKTSLLLVDLAGSETYNHVERHAQINVSLLALGRVLTALAKGQAHVPYRDSVLTRLLQQVLGEGGTTCMLACIHPAQSHLGETAAVLEYCRVTHTIERLVKRAQAKDIRTAAEREIEACGDPMEGDEYDADDDLMRRTEHVETRDHGTLHARCLGDAEAPLILYLHAHNKGSSSVDLNGMSLGCAEAFKLVRKAARATERKTGAEAESGPIKSRSSGQLQPRSTRSSEFELKPFEDPSEPAATEKKKVKKKSPSGNQVKAGTKPLVSARASSPRGGKTKPVAKQRSSMGFITRTKGKRKSETTDEDEEARHAAAQADDTRFFHLRAQLSSALVRAQRELSQTRCDLCSLQLRQPHRMLGCRHVLCQMCVEASVMYWDECPCCSTTTHATYEDPLHEKVLRLREDVWSALNGVKVGKVNGRARGRESHVSTDAWFARLEIAQRERRQSRRLVVMYGCEIVQTKSNTSKAVWYVKLVGTSFKDDLAEASNAKALKAGDKFEKEDVEEAQKMLKPADNPLKEEGFEAPPSKTLKFLKPVDKPVKEDHDEAQPTKAATDTEAGKVIEEVTINTQPHSPITPDDCTLAYPGDEALGFTAHRTISASRTEPLHCDILITWEAGLLLPPLKIRAVTPKAQVQRDLAFKRWIVVQLPPTTTRQLRLPPCVEYGDGVNCFTSGWIIFQTSKDMRCYFGPRKFGRVMPSASPSVTPRCALGDRSSDPTGPRSRSQSPIASKQATPISSPHMTPAGTPRNADEISGEDPTLCLAPLPRHALGRIADVQKEISVAASLGTPLSDVAQKVDPEYTEVVARSYSSGRRARASASAASVVSTDGGGPAPASEAEAPSLKLLSYSLLQHAATCTDQSIVDVYSKMVGLVFNAPRATRERLLRQLPNTDSEPDLLDACFHVAVDLPGHGLSLAKEPTPARLLASSHSFATWLLDVIRSLGKMSCLAIVAVEHSCSMVLKLLVDRPSICRAAILREPALLTTLDEKLLNQVLQPVLVLSGRSHDYKHALHVAQSLQQGHLVDVAGKGRQREHRAGTAIQEFLIECNQYAGSALPTKKMPLLTRLAGGVNAWKGSRMAMPKDSISASCKSTVERRSASEGEKKQEGQARKQRSSILEKMAGLKVRNSEEEEILGDQKPWLAAGPVDLSKKSDSMEIEELTPTSQYKDQQESAESRWDGSDANCSTHFSDGADEDMSPNDLSTPSEEVQGGVASIETNNVTVSLNPSADSLSNCEPTVDISQGGLKRATSSYSTHSAASDGKDNQGIITASGSAVPPLASAQVPASTRTKSKRRGVIGRPI